MTKVATSKERVKMLIFFMSFRPLVECVPKYYFSYLSTKTCVLGAQKDHLNEMVCLSTQNT